jgi:hypothetical protein
MAISVYRFCYSSCVLGGGGFVNKIGKMIKAFFWNFPTAFKTKKLLFLSAFNFYNSTLIFSTNGEIHIPDARAQVFCYL